MDSGSPEGTSGGQGSIGNVVRGSEGGISLREGDSALEAVVRQQFKVLTKMLDERFAKMETLLRMSEGVKHESSAAVGSIMGKNSWNSGRKGTIGPGVGSANTGKSSMLQIKSDLSRLTSKGSTIRSTSNGMAQPRVFMVSEALGAVAAQIDQDGCVADSLERARNHAHTGFIKTTKDRFNKSVSAIMLAPWWVMRPSSTKRLAWDIAGMLFLIYDLLAIPLQLAFQPGTSLFLMVMFWNVSLFWLADIPLTCCTGFYRHGAEELRPRAIFVHYVRTWLTFDLTVVTSDFVAFFGAQNSSETSKTMRLVRILRALRLLRLIKLKKLTETLMDHIDSDYFHLLLGMAKGTMFVLGMNHLIACTWYGISTLTSEGVDSWARSANFEIEEGISYRYLTALHWSLTQFTPASMEVVPRNIHERAFAVCVLMFALLVFSSFVSSITASMTQLRQLSWKFTKDLSMLRKYLRTRDISGTLSIRILRFVEYKLEKKSNEIIEGDVKLLGILSAQLRMELVHETYSPILTDHPFFHQFSTANEFAMRMLCNDAVSRLTFSMGDIVFEDRTKSDSMMFLTRGEIQYYSRFDRSRQESVPGVQNDSLLEKGDWCCEPALWTNWEHVGAMHAVENCDLLAISAPKLVQVLETNGLMAPGTWFYACKFVELLNEQSRNGCLTDLNSFEELVIEQMVTEAFTMDITDTLEGGMASVGANLSGRGRTRATTFMFGTVGVGRLSFVSSSRRSSRSNLTGSRRSTFRVHRLSAPSELEIEDEENAAAGVTADSNFTSVVATGGNVCSLDDAPSQGSPRDQGLSSIGLGSEGFMDGNLGGSDDDDNVKQSL